MVVDGHHFKNESYNEDEKYYRYRLFFSKFKEEFFDPVSLTPNGFQNVKNSFYNFQDRNLEDLNESVNLEETRKSLEDNQPQSSVQVNESEPLENVKNRFCTRNGMQASNKRLFSSGRRINPSETAKCLRLKNGDALEIRSNQTGGGMKI
ncbi:hypothetical protein MXB_5223 [Myxobolus squamalis]|nr:hypothetical protein MXB_5223 [Myxobolus squamalis]